jgi:hypothetical protein
LTLNCCHFLGVPVFSTVRVGVVAGWLRDYS